MSSSSDRERSGAVRLPDFDSVSSSDVSPLLGLYDPKLAAAALAAQQQHSAQNLYPAEWSNKTWSQRMIYYSGVSYATGIVGGGVLGAVQGAIHAKTLSNSKLKANAIVNRASRVGATSGNAFGILTLMFCSADSLLESAIPSQPSRQLVAAMATGAFYKSTTTPRTAIAAGILGGVAFSTFHIADQIYQGNGITHAISSLLIPF